MNQKFENVIQGYILKDEMIVLVRYLDEMKVNKDTKEEMVQAMQMFRLRVLYDVFLTRFRIMLSDEEKEKYERECQSFFIKHWMFINISLRSEKYDKL